jgi:ABC-type phosphate/phosphonate transport system, periplasmic component
VLVDLKGKMFSFGLVLSIFGYLMLCNYLLEVKINFDIDFKCVVFLGVYDVIIVVVVVGKVDVGVFNILVWDKFVVDKKVDFSKVWVFYIILVYFDYNWIVYVDMLVV